MADSIKISELDELVSGSVLGTTIVPVVDGGTTQHTKMSSIKAYVNSDVATDSELAAAIAGVNSTITALTTDDVAEGTNEYYTDARVKTKLDAESVLSGSTLSVVGGGSVDNVNTITFTGATVGGSAGSAIVTIAAASALQVLDGATTVNDVDKITFSGATITNDGGGDVTVTIANSLTVEEEGGIDVTDVTRIIFDGATVVDGGGGYVNVSIAAGDSVPMLIHTSSVNNFSSSVDSHIFGIATYTSSVDAHILDVATFTSSFSSSVESRIVTLESAGGSAIPDGTISGSQQITDFGYISSSFGIESKLNLIPGASLSITSESNGQTLDILIDVSGGPGGGTGDVTYTNGFHIISQSTSTLESNAILSEMYVDANQNITFTQFSSSVDGRFGSGGGSDYISNVSYGNNTLTFTGTGFGFNGSVPLSNGLVSSSNQITDLGFLNDGDVTAVYLAGKLPQGIVSGAQQITDLGFAGGGTGLISSSAQVILTQADSSSFTTYFIPEETNLYYTDERVKTKMDVEGVISSSAQISVPDGTISGSSQVDYAQAFNQLELRSGSNAILITSGTAGYGNPYITIGLDGTAFASLQTELDFGTLSDVFYGATIPSTSAQLYALGAVDTLALNALNDFTGSAGGFGVASSSLASRITTVENSAGGIIVEAGFEIISQSNSISNLILDLVRIDSTGVTFNDFSASVAAGGGAGASTFAGLTDTEFSSFVGGDLVKYNAVTEKWENTFQLNGAYLITGSLIVTGGAVTADSFVAGTVGSPIIDSATSLDISAATEIYLTSTGNGVVIEDILVLNPIVGDAPTSPLSGSIMASGSDGSFKPYFWDGNSWREISLV